MPTGAGHVFVLRDGGSPHNGRLVQEYVRRVRRLHLVRFPAYAPELYAALSRWATGARLKGSTVAVLRVSGADLNVDQFLAAHGLSVDRVWRRGESRRRGGVQDESGFNLTIANASSTDALQQEVSSFLEGSRKMRAGLTEAGASAELDVGLMIYAVAPTSVAFAPELLASLASEGIALRVTGYPCSEQ